jgi:hypothetical protein
LTLRKLLQMQKMDAEEQGSFLDGFAKILEQCSEPRRLELAMFSKQIWDLSR